MSIPSFTDNGVCDRCEDRSGQKVQQAAFRLTPIAEHGRMPIVLVTGTSSGIGHATTLELAKRGCYVFATMRNVDRSGPLESSLSQIGLRDQVQIEPLDVTDATSIRTAVDNALSRTRGRLDAVVHNAGMAVGGAFEDLPDDEQRRVMETNFFGVLALTRAVLPTFRTQRSGRIVIVSSDAAFFGQPANSIYSASKWAVEGWAEGIAYELERFGIDIVLVEPGPYRTSIWERSTRICPVDSAYESWLQQLFRAVDNHASATARDPAEVARTIASALAVTRPRFRYPVGPVAHFHQALRGIVPTRLLRKCVTWYLGLSNVPPT